MLGPDNKVKMADGEYRRAADIRVNDLIAIPVQGQTSNSKTWSRVTDVCRSTRQVAIELTLRDNCFDNYLLFPGTILHTATIGPLPLRGFPTCVSLPRLIAPLSSYPVRTINKESQHYQIGYFYGAADQAELKFITELPDTSAFNAIKAIAENAQFFEQSPNTCSLRGFLAGAYSSYGNVDADDGAIYFCFPLQAHRAIAKIALKEFSIPFKISHDSDIIKIPQDCVADFIREIDPPNIRFHQKPRIIEIDRFSIINREYECYSIITEDSVMAVGNLIVYNKDAKEATK